MECGCTVITNLDGLAGGLKHMANVVDINQCDRLPSPKSDRIGRAARKVALGRCGWDQLVGQLLAVAPAKDASGRSGRRRDSVA